MNQEFVSIPKPVAAGIIRSFMFSTRIKAYGSDFPDVIRTKFSYPKFEDYDQFKLTCFYKSEKQNWIDRMFNRKRYKLVLVKNPILGVAAKEGKRTQDEVSSIDFNQSIEHLDLKYSRKRTWMETN